MGSISFQTVTTTSSFGTGAEGVALGDFNGDGKLDAAVGNGGSNSLGILLGNGDGTFQSPSSVAIGPSTPPKGTNPYWVMAVDLDGDGKLDLVTANEGSGTNGLAISFLKGNGNGTFQPPQTFATGTAPSFIALADVNNDGKLDAVVNDDQSNHVAVLLGNGNGTFNAASSLSTPSTAFQAGIGQVVIADVNGDGKPDIVAGGAHNSYVAVLLGNNDGTFQAATTYASGVGTDTYTHGVAVGDLGNGHADIVSLNTSEGSISVFVGDGAGNFAAQQTYATGTAGGTPQQFVLRDLNGDGKLDVVAYNQATGVVAVLLGNGDTTFQAAQTFSVASSGAGIAIGDLNGDGRLDIVTVDSVNNQMDILLNNTDAAPVITVPSAQTVLVGTSHTISGISITDADADSLGQTLSVTLIGTNGTISITGGSGVGNNGHSTVTLTGTLTAINADLAQLSFTGSATGGGSIQVQASDGVVSASSQTLSLSVAMPAGTFTPPTATGTPAHSSIANPADLAGGSPGSPLVVNVGSVIGSTELNLPASGPGTPLNLADVQFVAGGATTHVVLFDLAGNANVTLPDFAPDNGQMLEFVASGGSNSIVGGAAPALIFGGTNAAGHDTIVAGAGGGVIGGAGIADISAGTSNGTDWGVGNAVTVWSALHGGSISGGGNYSEVLSRADGTTITASTTALNQLFVGDTQGGASALDVMQLSSVGGALDLVELGNGRSSITTAAGDADIWGGTGSVTIASSGSAGNLLYFGNASTGESTEIDGNAYVSLYAEAGNGQDSIAASAEGFSSIVGGTGTDTFFGSTGSALFFTQGSAGAHDTFQFADTGSNAHAGTFVIDGFSLANDTIQISALTAGDVTSIIASQHEITLTDDSEDPDYDPRISALLVSSPDLADSMFGEEALQITLSDGQKIDILGITSLLTTSNVIVATIPTAALTVSSDDFTGSISTLTGVIDDINPSLSTWTVSDAIATTGPTTFDVTMNTSDGGSHSGLTTSGVTTINFTLVDTSAASTVETFDAAGLAGLTTFKLSNSTVVNGTQDTFTVNNLAAGTKLAVDGNGTLQNFKANYVGAATAGGSDTVSLLVKGSNGVVSIGTGFETVAISTSGTGNHLTLLTAGTETTITVGGGDLTIDSGIDASVTDFNASAATGPISIFIASASSSLVVDGGSGDDMVTLNAGVLLTLASGSQLDGGAGTDTLIVDDANFGAQEYIGLNATHNFEIMGLTGTTVDASQIMAPFANHYDVTQGGNTILNAPNATILDITSIGNGPVTLSPTVGAFSATVNLGTTSSQGGVRVSNLDLIGLSHVALSSNGTNAATNILQTLTISDNTAVTVTGSNNLTFALSAGSVVGDRVDATNFTGNLNVTGSNEGDVLIGGSGNDTLIAGGGTLQTTLTGSGGNDTFDVHNGLASNVSLPVIDVIDDFTKGADTLKLVTQGIAVFTSAAINVTGEPTLLSAVNAAVAALGDGSANAQIDWFQFGGNTYVVEGLTAPHVSLAVTDLVVKLAGTIDLSTLSLTAGTASLF